MHSFPAINDASYERHTLPVATPISEITARVVNYDKWMGYSEWSRKYIPRTCSGGKAFSATIAAIMHIVGDGLSQDASV